MRSPIRWRYPHTEFTAALRQYEIRRLATGRSLPQRCTRGHQGIEATRVKASDDQSVEPHPVAEFDTVDQFSRLGIASLSGERIAFDRQQPKAAPLVEA